MAQQRDGVHPAARVAHRTAGRFRLQVPVGERTPAAMEELTHRLDATPGVKRTEVKPGTGSVVIYHEENEALEDLLDRAGLSESVLLDALPPRLQRKVRSDTSHVARDVTNWFYGLDARLSRATHGWIDLKMAIPLGLLGTAVWRTAVEGLAWVEVPPYVLLYYTFDTFIKFHQPTLERTAVPAERVGHRGELLPAQDEQSNGNSPG